MVRSIGMNVFFFVLLAVVVRNVQSENDCKPYRGNKCAGDSNIRFELHTSLDQRENLDVSFDNMSLSKFDPENPTKIIVHGFMGNSSDKHYVDMRSEYLKKGKFNVIMVQWSVLAKGPRKCFPVAREFAKFVGECMKGLIQLLRATYEIKDVHAIGHDLGVDVIISAGRGLDPKLSRFTALNPLTTRAYSSYASNPPKKSDAIFVDVIHTNFKQTSSRSALGLLFNAGHVDFYVNSGATQPGCKSTGPDRDGVLCSHLRSVLLYTESINSGTGFYGKQCDFQYIRSTQCGNVSSLTILMGDGVLTTTTGSVVVPTAAESPFALGQKD